MKLHQHKSVFAGILLCCWLLGGCEKEVIIPDLEGDIIGYLYTYDEFGLLSDHSDVKITTRGLDGSYSTYSDENGKYEFGNIPAGTYELLFSKEGFRNDTLKSVKHLGGKPTILAYSDGISIFRWTELFKYPQIIIQNITIEQGQLIIGFASPGAPGTMTSFMLYFSGQNGFENNSAIIFSQTFLLVDGVYKVPISLLNLPFEPEQEIYVKAAGLSDGFSPCATINNEGNYVHCHNGIVFYPLLGDESSQFTLVFPG